MQGEIVDMNATPAGRDILDLAKHLQTYLVQELRTFSAGLGADHYHARALSFWQQKKGKRLQWQRGSLQAALGEYFHGSVDRLDSALLEMTKERKEPTTAIWVHSTPVPNREAYFIYVMHHTGFTAAFEASEDTITLIEQPREAIRRAMESMLRSRPRIAAQWAELVAQHAKTLEDAMRDDVTQFLAQYGGQPLDDEKWSELMALIFYREESITAMQDIVRLRAQSWVIESQNLQNMAWRAIEKTGELLTEKITQVEKLAANQQKRLKADLDKYRSMHDLAATRVNQLANENHMLRQQIEKAGAGGSQQTPRNNLGLALDRFFQPGS